MENMKLDFLLFWNQIKLLVYSFWCCDFLYNSEIETDFAKSSLLLETHRHEQNRIDVLQQTKMTETKFCWYPQTFLENGIFKFWWFVLSQKNRNLKFGSSCFFPNFVFVLRIRKYGFIVASFLFLPSENMQKLPSIIYDLIVESMKPRTQIPTKHLKTMKNEIKRLCLVEYWPKWENVYYLP